MNSFCLKLSVSFYVATFAVSSSHETPVRTEIASILDKGIPITEPFSNRSKEQQFLLKKTILTDFDHSCLKWTANEQDALEKGTFTVRSFDQAVLFFDQHKDKVEIKLLNQIQLKKDLTELQKRALFDYYLTVKNRYLHEKIPLLGLNANQLFSDFTRLKKVASLKDLTKFKGLSSNSFFRTFFENEITSREWAFAADGIKGVKQGDDQLGLKKTLEKGENMWAVNLSAIQVNNDKKVPLFVIGLHLSDNKVKADFDMLGGRSVVIFANGDIRTYRVNRDGHILDGNINLIDEKFKYEFILPQYLE